MNKDVETSKTFILKVWGENACFTRPEMKVERVSYDVMTPSAARGTLEAILWKPAIKWEVEQMNVLKLIRWESVRRNEVGSWMSIKPNARDFFIEDKRKQRANLFLRDVAYAIHAHFKMTDKAEQTDNIMKFQKIFLRRAQKGQCVNQPYLGCREFSAHFQLIGENSPVIDPIDETRELGCMFFDMKHDASKDAKHAHTCTPKCHASFFKATMEHGRINLRGVEVRP